MKFSAPSWSAQPEGIQFGHSTSAVHHFHVEITTDSRVLTALHHPSCSRFEMNLQPGDTLPWKFPADVARRVSSPNKELVSPKKNKKKEHIINNKKTTRSWFLGWTNLSNRNNNKLPMLETVSKHKSVKFSHLALDRKVLLAYKAGLSAKNFSKFRAWNSFGMLLIV